MKSLPPPSKSLLLPHSTTFHPLSPHPTRSHVHSLEVAVTQPIAATTHHATITKSTSNPKSYLHHAATGPRSRHAMSDSMHCPKHTRSRKAIIQCVERKPDLPVSGYRRGWFKILVSLTTMTMATFRALAVLVIRA